MRAASASSRRRSARADEYAHTASGVRAMDFMKSIAIAAAGLRAQAGRMHVISENIANADSTPSRPGGDPYRRKIATFQSEMDRALDARIVPLRPVPTDSPASQFHPHPPP